MINNEYISTDPDVVRRLVIENPWSTIVSHTDAGLVASHCPVLLDETSEELAMVTHVGKPDNRLHRLGTGEILLIVAGPNGYISPGWYSERETPVPTWNFSVAHCYGTPEILDLDENVGVLTRLVSHFERRLDAPTSLDQSLGESLARYTVGIRLPIARFLCKIKMSQDKDLQSTTQVIDALLSDGPYKNPSLANEMLRVLSQ